MLSIRALICSPDCGIKIDMRDRSSVWRWGPPRFLQPSRGNVGRRVTTPPGAVESSVGGGSSGGGGGGGAERQKRSTAAASRNVKEIPQHAACIFHVSYLCNIYQPRKFSAHNRGDIVSIRSRRHPRPVAAASVETSSSDCV